jgi:hypothetical protein
MSKHYYAIVDTETTKKQSVADFGAVVVTRKGKIVEQFGAMVLGHFGKFDLFSDPSAPDSAFWSEQSAQRRAKDYDAMLESGERSISSPALINQWLAGVNARYAPVLTAYNLSFDLGKCRNTRINLGIFSERFCLMKAAKKVIGSQAAYHDFCYDNDLLTAKLRNPSMTADTMAKFILGLSLADEPHTALEDARDYEAAILTYILRNVTRKQLLELGQ